MNGTERSIGWTRQALPLLVALVMGALLLLGSPAQGTSLKLTLDQLATGADTVVLGTVVSTAAHWDAEKSFIYTVVTLAVEEQYKGPPLGKTIAILVLGGARWARWAWPSRTCHSSPWASRRSCF